MAPSVWKNNKALKIFNATTSVFPTGENRTTTTQWRMKILRIGIRERGRRHAQLGPQVRIKNSEDHQRVASDFLALIDPRDPWR